MKKVITLLNIVFGIIGVLSAIPALFSIMMFDAPGTIYSPLTILAAITLIMTPLSCIGSIIISREIMAKPGQEKRALVIALSPLVFIASFGISMGLIELICGGSFSCHL